MKVKKIFLVLGFLFILLGLIECGLAGFEIGNKSHSIQTTYLKNSYLKGWINMSFNKTPENYLFKDIFNNNFTLKQILASGENNAYNYSCEPVNCLSSYLATNRELTKSFSMNTGQEKIFGFKLKNNLVGINSLEMELQSSDSGLSCYSQIKLDFGNDDIIEILNNKSSSEYCPLRYSGCFNLEGNEPPNPDPKQINTQIVPMAGNVILSDLEEILLTDTPLCQKIKILESPKIGIGAWIKEVTAGNRKIVMELFDNAGDFIDTCNLSKAQIGNVGGRVVCNINLKLTEPEEHYVCLHTEGTSGEYKTRGYIPENNSCGFIGYPPAISTSAYDIFVQPLKFNAVGTLKIDNNFGSNETLAEIIESYIMDKYGNLNCSNECLIPVKIYSQANQTITLKNLKLNYNKAGLGVIEEKYFYDFEEISPKINSTFQKLNLDNLFIISGTHGQINYKMFFNDSEIFRENITIENIEMGLSPNKTAATVSTSFRVTLNPSKNITEYEWNFGDGTSETTVTNAVKHTYTEVNNYTLIVTAVRNSTSEEITKNFDVIVESPASIILTTIETLRENIENLTEEVSNFDTFTQQRIEEILNLEEKEAQLNQLEEDFEQAQSEEEYIEIATSLFAIEIPSSIISTSLGEVNLYFQKSNVNLDSLTAITGEEYGSESSKYIDSVLSWQQEKFKTKGTTQKIFFKYEDETEEVLNIFDLRFEKSGSYEPYFIIENIANMKMSLNFSERTDYSYVKIASSENRLKISTTEAVGVTEIPAFISPKLSELNLKGIKKEKEDFDFKLLIIILAILIVLIVAYFLVVFLNRKKKEKKLFGNKKNAENILKYIKKEKEKGTPDFEIKNNLRKSQWTPEQIEYVMEKHSK